MSFSIIHLRLLMAMLRLKVAVFSA